MFKSLRHLLRILGDICFLPRCLICKEDLSPGEELLLCAVCLPKITLLTGNCCSLCGLPFRVEAGGHLCGTCLRGDTRLDAARSIVVYQGPIRDTLHAFKYGRQTACVPTFGILFRRVFSDLSLFDADYIVPVPLHKGRLRQRGFNQSMVLAREFFREQRGKIKPFVIQRLRPTEPQASLSARQRRTNLRGAFGVGNPELVRGKSIVLVDDIFTTGATLNECARVLKKAGAIRVVALTLARAINA